MLMINSGIHLCNSKIIIAAMKDEAALIDT